MPVPPKDRAAPLRSGRNRIHPAQAFLAVEAASFAAAALVHAGMVLPGWEHAAAARAETVIAAALVAAVCLGRTPGPWPLRCAAGGQIFALAGVFAGLFAIRVGVGPQSIPDLAYHVVMVPVLVSGIAVSVPDRRQRLSTARDRK